jgi:hypothetical protein
MVATAFAADMPVKVHVDGTPWGHRLAGRLEGAVRHDRLNPRRGVSDSNDGRQVALRLSYCIHANRERVQLNDILCRAGTAPDPADAWLCQYRRFF